MNCRLCEKKRLTKWYYSDDYIWIADCKTCHIPMLVLNRHATNPTLKEGNYIRSVLNSLYGFGKWTLRGNMRSIKDHYHEHIILK